MGSAVRRRAAAWLGAWEGGVAALGRSVGVPTVLGLEESWPEFGAQVRAMEQDIAAYCAILDALK